MVLIDHVADKRELKPVAAETPQPKAIQSEPEKPKGKAKKE